MKKRVVVFNCHKLSLFDDNHCLAGYNVQNNVLPDVQEGYIKNQDMTFVKLSQVAGAIDQGIRAWIKDSF